MMKRIEPYFYVGDLYIFCWMRNSESGIQIESWNQEETEKQQKKEKPRDYVPPCNDGHLGW